MGEGSALGIYNQCVAGKTNNSIVKDTEEVFIAKPLLLAEIETWP